MSTDPKPTPSVTEQAPAPVPVTPEEDGHKVFVGNLSFKTKEEGLVSFFETSGKVLEAKIITLRPHYRKRSAGYGFVTFATLEEATKAAADLNKKELDGREINVEVARPKPAVTEQDATKPKQKKRRARKNKDKAENQVTKEETEDTQKKTKEDKNKVTDEETSTASENDDSTTSDASSSRAPRRKTKSKTKKPAEPRRPKKELTEQSETSLFVGNLPYASTDETLQDVFKDLKVVSAHVARMRNGRSKGYGFVEMETHDEQTKALETIKDVQIEGRTLYLSIALSAPEEDAPLDTEE